MKSYQMVNQLIDVTVKKINQQYHPGTLAQMKLNRPDDWGNMLALEGRVNEIALGGTMEGLRKALSEYQGLILSMVKEFKAIKEEKGQGMFNFWVEP